MREEWQNVRRACARNSKFFEKTISWYIRSFDLKHIVQADYSMDTRASKHYLERQLSSCRAKFEFH